VPDDGPFQPQGIGFQSLERASRGGFLRIRTQRSRMRPHQSKSVYGSGSLLV
jgi:hypothetical protein